MAEIAEVDIDLSQTSTVISTNVINKKEPVEKCNDNRMLGSVIVLMATFNSVDLFARGDLGSSMRRKTMTKVEMSWIAIFARYLYVHCSVRMIVNCVLQYSYDNQLLELNWYRSLAAADNKTTSEYDDQIVKLEQQIAPKRSRIKLLGSPYMNAAYLIEIGYIYLIWFTLASFALPQIYQRFWAPFNSGLLRILIDRQRELVDCRRMVANEVNIFIQSSRNFVDYMADAMSLYSNQKTLTEYVKFASLYSKRKLGDLTDHASTAATLKHLSSSDGFRPLNRTNEWLRIMSILATAFLVLYFLTLLGLFLFLTVYMFSNKRWLGKIKLERDFMDIVMRGEIMIFGIVVILSSVFYVVSVTIMTIDQIYYLLQLNSMIRGCTKLTVSIINSINDESAINTSTASYDQLNRNILEIMIQYKVLVRQMSAMKNTCNCIASLFVLAISLAPVLSFIHAPVFEEQMIIVMFLCTMFTLVWMNLCLTPACMMHSKGVDIYRSMLDLLIQLTYLRQLTMRRMNTNLLNNHVVLSLRRELSIPDRLIDQFTFKALAIPLTYQNIVKTQFWSSLLILFALEIFHASNRGGGSKSFANPLSLL